MKVEIALATSLGDREIVSRLYPMYLHDLSAFTDYYSLDSSGVWQPDFLPDWLNGDLQHPFLIWADGWVAGLCFVAEAPFPHMAVDCDHQISEFFVLHPFRRRGVGEAAARLVFDRWPGAWVVAEIDKNEPAIAFWRKVIDRYTSGHYAEEPGRDGELLQRFISQ